MPVRTISIRAMQVMVDMVMDLLDRVAREAASILELEVKPSETLTVDEIHTSARLVLQEGKDRENACRPLLKLNLVRYVTLKFTQYMS